MKHINRLSLSLLLGLTTFAAIAASAHFVRGPFSSLNSDGSVTVNWKEAGLGDTSLVSYTASATAAASYQCVNHGGRCPQAANKQDVLANVSASGQFSSGKNGSITAGLTMGPPAGTLVCPGNQHLEMFAVSYTNIALSDTTNGVSAPAFPSSWAFSGDECP